MSAYPQFWGLFPFWLIVTGSLLLLLLEVLFKEGGRKIAPILANTILLLALGSVFWLLSNRPMLGPLFHGAVVIDLYSLTLQGICLVSGLLACVFSVSYLRRERAVTGEYYALLLLTVSGMMILVMASEFLTLFVGLELMSLSSYVLSGYLRVQEKSLEASLKYFLTGVFASAFFLYGVAYLYGATGSIQFQDIRQFLEQGHSGSLFVKLGVALVLVGFGYKTASVPFHNWAPDVYDGAPAPVTSLLASGVKAAAFGAFARLFAEPFSFPGSWANALIIMAVLSMTVGNLGALLQTSVKRMLSYSSVAHAGYLLVGLSVASYAPSDQTERAVAFYLLAYTLMSAGAFGWLASEGGKGESQLKIGDFRGFGSRHPWRALWMSFFLFSLAGMTPTAGFFGKYYLFKLSVDHGLVGLTLIAVLNSFVSAYYYLRVVAHFYMKPSGEFQEEIGIPSIGLQMTFFLCALAILVVGFLKFPF